MLWINLTQNEKHTLDHLDCIHSGFPQLVEITAGQPVVINAQPRPDLPVPDAESVRRMQRCLHRSTDLFETFEQIPGGFRVKPVPFEQRGLTA